MPSLPSQRRNEFLALLLLSAMLAACGGTTPEPKTQPSGLAALGISEEEQRFLQDPLLGYPLVVEAERKAEVSTLYRTLQGGELTPVTAGIERLLEADPGFHPASVLGAQVHFAERRYTEAVGLLNVVTGELPGYTAAQLLAGYLAEIRGDLPEAYSAYQAIEGEPLAQERGVEIRPRVLEILGHRLTEALDRGRLDQAEVVWQQMERWAPGEESTLEGAWQLTAAGEDPAGELTALTALLAVRPDERDLLLRRADLEFLVGRPRRGVEILRRLVEEAPDDLLLAEKLDVGKLRLRVSLLPGEVQALADQTALSRADYAVLLYWLMPGVRSGHGASPRIATDILEHPQRKIVARVINQRLMNVDETLHRFSPDKGVTRLEALGSLLKVLSQGGEEGLPACLGAGSNPNPSTTWVCDTAARCQLIEAAGDCLPRAPVSGTVALEFMQRSLRQIGDGSS